VGCLGYFQRIAGLRERPSDKLRFFARLAHSRPVSASGPYGSFLRGCFRSIA